MMRLAGILASAAFVLAGCSAGRAAELGSSTPRTRATAAPTATPAATITPAASTQAILFNEATRNDGSVVRNVGCRAIVGGWVFQESGERVTLYRRSDGTVSGMRPPEQPNEVGTGEWKDGVLRVHGDFSTPQPGGVARKEPVVYELRRDSASGHLVGTRNGTAIRLAPTEIHKPPDCPDGPVP